MRPASTVLSFLLVAASAFASSSGPSIRFDPPNPTSRTPVAAHVVGNFSGCNPTVSIGAAISITLSDCSVQAGAAPIDLPVDLGVLPAGVYDVVAGTPMILIALAEGRLIVQDAAPPFEVVPNAAFPGQSITGKNLIHCATGPSPIVCDPYTVKVGGNPASVVRVPDFDHIVIAAPAHDPAPVDVTIEYGSGTVLHSTAAFDYVAQDGTPAPAFFEPVLFPVTFSGPGAFGSQWTTDLHLDNASDDPVVVLLPAIFVNPACHFILSVSGLPPPHQAVRSTVNTPGGVVAYIPRQTASKLFFGLLVRDLSRRAEALGTEIAVVREKDFFDHPLELLNVPSDPRFRGTLRIDDLGIPPGIHLRIQPLSGGDALVESVVFPTGHDPASVRIDDLTAAYPQLAGKGPLRITIDPPIPGDPSLWAFASVTNNDTQEVTTISRQ